MAMTSTSDEEVDNLIRNTKKVKTNGQGRRCDRYKIEEESGHFEESRKSSYRDKVMGLDSEMHVEGLNLDLNDDAYDVGEWVDDEEGPWFSMGTTKEEKKEARKPWHLSLITKLFDEALGTNSIYIVFNQC